MNYEALISEYGYLAILIGMFIEGETFLLLGGLAARFGYLDLRALLLVASGGAFFSDHLNFYIGRYRGQWIMSHFPRLRPRANRILARLHRHHILVSVGFRFLYGFRTVTPFLLGSSGVRPWRFSALNLVGTLCWTGLFGLLGYMIGEVAMRFLQYVKRYEFDLAMALLAAGALWHLILRIRARRKNVMA